MAGYQFTVDGYMSKKGGVVKLITVNRKLEQENTMTQQYDIKGMTSKIRALRRNAEALKELSGGIPAVDRNADRILANVKMLEINISDVVGILSK
jgi:isopentenyl phosphate kinase